MRRAGVGLDRVGDSEAQCLVDELPARDVVPVDQRDGDAGASGAAGTTDAVDVGLLVLGALVVDDVGDVVDVDTAGSDVGGDQNVDLAVTEALQRLFTGDLAEVTVDGTDGEAAFREIVGHLLGCALGAGEDHRRAAAFGLQDAGDHLGLVERVCTVDVLAGAIVHRGGFGLFGADVRRLRQEGASQGDDRAGHRRGEEHRLTLVGDHAHEAFDVGEESQVEHFVGLVEDENAHLAQDQVRLVGEVEQATRGADDNVDALLECRDLRLVRTAAVDGQNLETAVADPEVLAGVLEVAGDLDAQLAGGNDDQSAGRAVENSCAVLGGDDAMQERDAETEGLAHSGAGLTDEVVTGESQRKGEFLDGEGALDADLVQCADDFVADTEFGEARGYMGVVELDGNGVLGCFVFVVDSDLAQGTSLSSWRYARTR